MIKLDGIVKGYSNKTVLDGVSLAIGEGEAVAVVGESGAGKSTLGRMLLRLERPESGSYQFSGQDVLGLRGSELRSWRHNVQAVFQNPWQSLNPRLHIERLVTEPLDAFDRLNRRERSLRAAELLELVGLSPELRRRYPHQLSGGQRQRVAIARAVSVHPRLLVLDEPVTALDVSVRAQVLNLLSRLIRDFGIAVVYITHDLATARYIASRSYVLYQGTIMEEIATRRLVTDPDNPYSRLLLGAVLSVGEAERIRERVLPASEDAVSSGTSSCCFAPRCGHRQSICSEARPDLLPVAEAWRSRCHFAGATKPTLLKTPDAEVGPMNGTDGPDPFGERPHTRWSTR